MKGKSVVKGVVSGVAAVLLGMVLAFPVSAARADTTDSIQASATEDAIESHLVVQPQEGAAIGEPAQENNDEEAAALLSARNTQGTIVLPVTGNLHQPEAYSMLATINAERARKGAAPLKWDQALEETAVQRAAEISLSFAHNRPDGSLCFTAFPSDLWAKGENILYGASSATGAYGMWKNSPAHYSNMVNTDFTKVGIACIEISGQYYWVQCFGSGGVDYTGPSLGNFTSLLYVTYPDSAVVSVSWTANKLTPGVNSMRALPTATVAIADRAVRGTVTYPAEYFNWNTNNQAVARFTRVGSNVYVVGISEGTTSIVASFWSTTKLNKNLPVVVTKDGAFTDVGGNTPHRSSILWLSGTGVTAGYNDGSYRPYADVARCDMAAFLRRLAIVMGVSDAKTWVPSDNDWAKFSDVKTSTPHAEDILWLAHSGISTGFNDATFRPYNTIARCDMSAFLRRLAVAAGSVDAKNWNPSGSDWKSFNDVPSRTDHVKDVLWLAHAGVSTGFPDHGFHPYATVTRCDMAAFLQRLVKVV